MKWDKFIYKPGGKLQLSKIPTVFNGEEKHKNEVKKLLQQNLKELGDYQDRLYAYDKYSLLIILQAMDAAGKDGMISHVMKGVNPMGCQVKSFKAPNAEELNHDYLWRCIKALPERGNIGIFNRSYYEEVLVTRVHCDLILNSKIPALPLDPLNDKDFWHTRFHDINNFEKYIINNGTVVLKFFLHISKKEQKERLLSRIDNPKKNWKFSEADLHERLYWNKYTQAYEDMLENTSSEKVPWYVVPSDNKWFSRLVVSDIIVDKLKSLNLSYPVVTKEMEVKLREAKKLLEKEE